MLIYAKVQTREGVALNSYGQRRSQKFRTEGLVGS